MWEIAPGFRPDLTGLTENVRVALERLGEKVRAAGGVLQVTSAYRPGGRTLHGRGEAVDVWVPGWGHRRIAEYGQKAGFAGGYIPRHGRFVELVTAPYWYSVPGEKFGFGENGVPPVERKGLLPDAGELWDIIQRRTRIEHPYIPGVTPPGMSEDEPPGIIPAQATEAGILGDINWTRGIIIAASIVLIILLIVRFVQGGDV